MRNSLWTLLASATLAHGAATITLINVDGPGVGLNDPTPATPVGGNTGTTIGQQRANAMLRAAELWAESLDSTTTITMRVSFAALTCTATAGTLAQAGPRRIWSFTTAPSAIRLNTWYPQALANQFAGFNLAVSDGVPLPDGADLSATFNSNLGAANCLAGSSWYYGLDTNQLVSQTNFVIIALHEFAHGLGFTTTTSGVTGNQLGSQPYISDHFIFDTTAGKNWTQLTATERQASALNFRRVVWTGPETTANSNILNLGTAQLQVSGAAAGAAAGAYPIGTASFGPAISSPGVSGDIMPVIEAGALGQACAPLTGANALAVNGNIGLVVRGGCTFASKARVLQTAGARGMILVNNAAGSAPPLGGADPLVTIPSVGVSQSDGNAILARLATRSRTRSGVVGTLLLNLAVRAGADALGRVLIFTPNPFQGGSSMSHFDTSASPNLVMEPNYSSDLSFQVGPPRDLTRQYLRDIGWGLVTPLP